MIASTLFALLALAAPALSAPSLYRRQTPYGNDSFTPITAAQIVQIAPNSTACDPAASFASECRTAEQAAPFVNAGFQQFGVNTVGEQAALLSLMIFETGGFRFDRNHFPAPGRPGQGTRNLMMFPFVAQYALDTNTTAGQAAFLLAPFTANGTDINAVPDTTKNAVLGLLLSDETLSFASAAWFYKAAGVCGEDIVTGLKAGTEAGWEAYITQCIGTTVTDDRKTGYLAALNALSTPPA